MTGEGASKDNQDRLREFVNELFADDPQPTNNGAINSISDFVKVAHFSENRDLFSEIETPEQRKAAAAELCTFNKR